MDMDNPAADPSETVQATPLRTLQKELLAHLSEDNRAAAGEVFGRLVGVPGWLDLGFEPLHARMKVDPGAGRLARTFLDMLLLRSDMSLSHLRTIAKIFEVGAATGQDDKVYDEISRFAASEAAAAPRFSNLDLLAFLSRFGPKTVSLLAKLKYKGADRLDAAHVLAMADNIASRLDLTFGLEDRLHAATRFSGSPRQEWGADVRRAFAIDTVLADWTAFLRYSGEPSRTKKADVTRDLLDAEAIARGFRDMDPAKGTLFAFFHGGYVNLVCDAFLLGTKNGVMMGRMGGAHLISVENAPAALYRGVRCIEDGRSILIAADARAGKYNATIRVLGVDVPVAEGAPFIAYETGCETIWLGVERSGTGFAPVFVQGPSRRTGERFARFRERWLAFYANQIGRALTGDPRDLTLRMQWAGLFSGSLDLDQSVA